MAMSSECQLGRTFNTAIYELIRLVTATSVLVPRNLHYYLRYYDFQTLLSFFSKRRNRLLSAMDPLRGPTPLQKLLKLYDANTCHCLGCSFPAHEGCRIKIDSDNDNFKLALADLRNLLSVKWENHGPGLIDMLESIAHAFSCSKHQQSSGHISQFTYYWLALDSLPNLVECMGFVLGLAPGISADVDLEPRCGVRVCPKDRLCVHRIKDAVKELTVGKVRILRKALENLTGQWLDNKNNKSGPSRLREMLDNRIATSHLKSDYDMLHQADRRWDSWHLARAAAVEGDGESPLKSRVRNTRTQKFESNIGSKVEGTLKFDKASSLTAIEESPRRDALHENLARGPSNLRSVSSPQATISRPLITERNIHTSAPTILQQPKRRQNLAPRERRRASAPRALEPLDDGPSDETKDSGQLPGLPKPKKRRQSYDPAVFNDQNSQTAAGITLRSTSGHSALLGQQLQISSPPESTVPLRAGVPRGDRIAEEIQIETGHHPSNLSSGAFETFSEDLSVLDGTGELIDQQKIVGTKPPFPDFKPLEGRKPARFIAHSIFDIMQKPLSDKKELDKGRIYTLRISSRPGYVKIGRTENTILKRKKQIDACFPYELEIINEDDHCKIPNHTRIEALVHAELQNDRRYFKCPCGRKARGKIHGCEGNDGMTQHGEWFEIDVGKACKVVSRWRKWMSLDPYSDGNLRPTEQARVDHYTEDPELMKTMTVEDKNGEEHWDWDKYMDSPQWRLHSLWIYKTLFGPRFDKSNHSRWDSLGKYWKSNVIFYFTCLLLPYVLFVVSFLLHPMFSSTLVFAVTNNAIIGAGAILYAA